MKKLLIFSLILTSVYPAVAQEKKGIEQPVYVGTYTKKEGHVDGKADGISLLLQDPATGVLKGGKTVARLVNPSFVKTTGKNLIAVSELGPGDAKSGFVYSFRVNPDHSLTQTSRLSTEGFAPAHIEVDKTGYYVFVSNYAGGVVMMYRILPDGSLKKQQRIDLENPGESHAHSVTVANNNKHIYVADLGNDRIWIFDFDVKKGKLKPNKQPYIQLKQGTGPRHFTVSNDGSFAWSINELNSTVSGFKIKKDGGLEEIQNVSSLPESFSGTNWPADIHLHPSGKFLYVSNRGHNSIAAFKVDPETGKLTSPEFIGTIGKTPRSFAISPDGTFLYVANQDSDNVISFRIQKNGSLQPMKSVKVKTPVSLEFRRPLNKQ